MKRLLLSFVMMSVISIILTSCGAEAALQIEGHTSGNDLQNVSIEDAQIELEKLLSDLSSTFPTRYDEDRTIEYAYTVYDSSGQTRASEETKPLIHVYNFANRRGFAIMSAYEPTPTLLALTEVGKLDEGDFIDNPGMSIFIEKLHKYVFEKAELGPGIPPAGYYITYGDWENVFYNKDGICPVEWSQNSPYNKECPLKNNVNCLTGCTATAIAQLMAVYKFPSTYNGYEFNWDEMTKSPRATDCSKDGKQHIARLMQQLGLKNNLNVDYGIDDSSASEDNIERTFKNFGYSKGGNINIYNTDDVIAELIHNKCVLCTGFREKKDTKVFGLTLWSSYSHGHTWLLHGLLERRRKIYTNKNNECVSVKTESQWYPLCNWGWGGNYNGFFLSGVFDYKNKYEPKNTESDETRGSESLYQYKLKAITGIRK